MLDTFRKKYPNGGIISELVKIDRHLYIVKVSIVVDGIILSSGLASAETIEMAEDKARIRAIDALQLDLLVLLKVEQPTALRPLKSEVQSASKSETKLSSQQRENVSNVVPIRTTVNGKTNDKNQPDLSSTLDTSSVTTIDDSEINSNQTNNITKESNSDLTQEFNGKDLFKVDSTVEDKPLPIRGSPPRGDSTPTQGSLFKSVSSSSPFSEATEEFVPIEDIPEPIETDAVDPSYYSQSHTQPATTSSGKPAVDPSSSETKPKTKQEDSVIVLEYNDVIDETNIHIERIRWSKEQGRNYLIETYGKRSRHSLTEQQLFEFLEFLRKQPDP